MTKIRTLLAPAALLLCLASAGTAHAAGGSLTYAKDGNVFLSAPDGSRATQLTADGDYAWPSQADDGTLVAVRQTSENGRTPRRLHRMDRSGRALNAPVVSVPVDNSYYVGPLAPKVSPDGRFVAYHYFYTGPVTDSTAPRIGISHSDRDTVNGEITSTLGGYLTPSWTQDGRLLAFYAKERTYHVDIWNPDDSVTNWFGDPAVATLLTDGELTRAGDRLVAVGDQNDLRFYDAGAAAPVLRCTMTGFNGDVSDPTWSPDGDALAWEEADGVHVAQLADLGACASAARPLVMPGGQDPDWAPPARRPRPAAERARPAPSRSTSRAGAGPSRHAPPPGAGSAARRAARRPARSRSR
jgi:dipeptidyl aminopeptidase/acylaminoacyl peptidase